MYVLVMVLPDGRTLRFVSRNKTGLRAILKDFTGTVNNPVAWRMTARDGGWESGSEDAWKLIQSAYGSAEIVL